MDGELVARGEAIDPADVIVGATALHRNEPDREIGKVSQPPG